MVPSDHDAGEAHAEGPNDQQDAEGDGQHQVVEEEFGEHGCPAGVPSRERVGVHGQVVQHAGAHVVRALALGQLLQARHDHDVQQEGCETRGEEERSEAGEKGRGGFHGRAGEGCGSSGPVRAAGSPRHPQISTRVFAAPTPAHP